MEKRATIVLTSHQVTENQALLVFEPPTECHHSNTRVKRHSSLEPLLFQNRDNHMHSLLGYAGVKILAHIERCTSYKKGRVQLHDICFCNKEIYVMFTQLWLIQHMPLVLYTVPDRVTSCSSFSDNHGWKMITITLPVNFQKHLLHQWARVQQHPWHKISSTELITEVEENGLLFI